MSASAVFGGIGLVMSALQYRSTEKKVKAEQEFYNAQARNRRLQGRVEAVEAKEKGNEILRRTKALASNQGRICEFGNSYSRISADSK